MFSESTEPPQTTSFNNQITTTTFNLNTIIRISAKRRTTQMTLNAHRSHV